MNVPFQQKVLPKRQDKYAQHQIQPKAARNLYSLNLADLSVSFLKIYLNKDYHMGEVIVKGSVL